MAVDNNTFVAGHFSATFDAADMGTTEKGFQFRPVYHREDIKIDDFGDTIVDGIWRGYNLRMNCQLSEWAAAARERLQFLFDYVDAGTIGTIQLIGQTLTKFAKQMVMTPIAGINSNLQTWTFPLVVPDTDHGAWNKSTTLKRVDVNTVVLPNRSTGVLFTKA